MCRMWGGGGGRRTVISSEVFGNERTHGRSRPRSWKRVDSLDSGADAKAGFRGGSRADPAELGETGRDPPESTSVRKSVPAARHILAQLQPCSISGGCSNDLRSLDPRSLKPRAGRFIDLPESSPESRQPRRWRLWSREKAPTSTVLRFRRVGRQVSNTPGRVWLNLARIRKRPAHVRRRLAEFRWPNLG